MLLYIWESTCTVYMATSFQTKIFAYFRLLHLSYSVRSQHTVTICLLCAALEAARGPSTFCQLGVEPCHIRRDAPVRTTAAWVENLTHCLLGLCTHVRVTGFIVSHAAFRQAAQFGYFVKLVAKELI